MSATTPTLRFPEFEEPWKPAHAGDAFRSSRARGRDGLPIYSVTLDRGLVPRASLDRRFAADAADGQNLRAQPGDLVYNTMRMWQGAVGRADVECMVSPAYVVLAPKKGISSGFFNYWFQHPRMRHLLGAYSHGLTSDRLRLYPDDFAQIPLSLPKPAEQERIAKAFEAIDRKIALLREEEVTLQKYKTVMSDRLFRRVSRFRRVDGEHFESGKTAKLGDLISDLRAGVSVNGADSAAEKGERGVLKTSCLSGGRFLAGENKAVKDPVEIDRLKEPIAGGTILISRMNTPSLVGASAYVSSDYPNLFLPDRLWAATADRKVSARWLGCLLSSTDMMRAISERATGTSGSMKNLSKTALLTIEVDVPQRDEQERIAAALSYVDKKIEIVSDQIRNMSLFRDGLIYAMFP